MSRKDNYFLGDKRKKARIDLEENGREKRREMDHWAFVGIMCRQLTEKALMSSEQKKTMETALRGFSSRRLPC